MNPMQSIIAWLIRSGTSILCQIEGAPLTKVPDQGPLILVINPVNSLEMPLLHSHLHPRRTTGIAKVETWDSRFLGWLFDLWEAIPVRRGEPDVEAFHRSLEVLKEGGILTVAPEGTRSRHGRLLKGRPGVVILALHSGAPILPIAHWGGEQFSSNLKKMKRTPFHVRVGKPFYIQSEGVRVTREIRQAMVDEIMIQLAALLPEEYRGEYNHRLGSTRYLRFA